MKVKCLVKNFSKFANLVSATITTIKLFAECVWVFLRICVYVSVWQLMCFFTKTRFLLELKQSANLLLVIIWFQGIMKSNIGQNLIKFFKIFTDKWNKILIKMFQSQHNVILNVVQRKNVIYSLCVWDSFNYHHAALKALLSRLQQYLFLH